MPITQHVLVYCISAHWSKQNHRRELHLAHWCHWSWKCSWWTGIRGSEMFERQLQELICKTCKKQALWNTDQHSNTTKMGSSISYWKPVQLLLLGQALVTYFCHLFCLTFMSETIQEIQTKVAYFAGGKDLGRWSDWPNPYPCTSIFSLSLEDTAPVSEFQSKKAFIDDTMLA